jgi:hypothetical protein
MPIRIEMRDVICQFLISKTENSEAAASIEKNTIANAAIIIDELQD